MVGVGTMETTLVRETTAVCVFIVVPMMTVGPGASTFGVEMTGVVDFAEVASVVDLMEVAGEVFAVLVVPLVTVPSSSTQYPSIAAQQAVLLYPQQ